MEKSKNSLIHFEIITDEITFTYLRTLLNEFSDSKIGSPNFYRIDEVVVNEKEVKLQIRSTEKIYRIIYNKKLKVKLTINEEN
jgi:hypothetical protein